MVVLVVTVAIPAVTVVVGQREQEVVAVTCVTASVPLRDRITTNQALVGVTTVELRDHDGCAFAVTAAVEGARSRAMDAALVAQGPGLVRVTDPSVDLNHLVTAQQGTAVEQLGYVRSVGSVVTTVGTTVELSAQSVFVVGVRTNVTMVACTEDLTVTSTCGTLTESSAVTTVGTGHVLRPTITL